MLKRLPRCLSRPPRLASSTLRSFRPRSRRKLHSAFWRHGATELECLPYYHPAMRQLFEPFHPTASSPNIYLYLASSRVLASIVRASAVARHWLKSARRRESISRSSRNYASQIAPSTPTISATATASKAQSLLFRPLRRTMSQPASSRTHVGAEGSSLSAHGRTSLSAEVRAGFETEAHGADMSREDVQNNVASSTHERTLTLNSKTQTVNQSLALEPENQSINEISIDSYEAGHSKEQILEQDALQLDGELEGVDNANHIANVSESRVRERVVVRAEEALDEFAASLINVQWSEKSDSMLKAAVQKLSRSQHVSNVQKLIEIFEQIPEPSRDYYATARATLAYSKLGKLNKAVEMHGHLLTNFSPSTLQVSSELLMTAITENQAGFAFQVWKQLASKHANMPVSDFEQHTSGILQRIRQNSNLWQALQSMLIMNSNEVTQISLVGRLIGVIVQQDSSLQTNRPTEVLSFLLAHQLTTREYYEIVCEKVMRSTAPFSTKFRQISSCYELYRKVKPFSPTGKLLYETLKVAAKAPNDSLLRSVAGDWTRVLGREKFTPAAVNQVAKFYTRHDDFAAANEVVSKYLDNGGSTEPVVLSSLLHYKALQGDVQATKECLDYYQRKNAIRPDNTLVNIILQAHARSGSFASLWSELHAMAERGYHPDGYTIGLILSQCAKRGDLEALEKIFEIARNYNIKPAPAVVQSLVSFHLYRKNYDAAIGVVESASHGMPRNDITRLWTGILDVLAQQRFEPRLVQVLHKMEAAKVGFSNMTYAVLMRHFVATGKLVRARTILFHTLKQKDLEATELHYSILMEGYSKAGNYHEALKVYAKMLERGILASSNVQLTLLKLHSRAAKFAQSRNQFSEALRYVQLAEQLLDEVLESHDSKKLLPTRASTMYEERFSPSYTISARWFDVVLNMYLDINDYNAYESLIQRFELMYDAPKLASSLQLPLPMVLHFMKLRLHQGSLGEVERFWEIAKQTGARLFQPAGNSSTSVRASRMFQSALARHLDVLMRAISAHGNLAHITSAIEDLIGVGFNLDSRNINLYVEILAERGYFLRAFAFFEDLLIARRSVRGTWMLTRRGSDIMPSYSTLSFLEKIFKRIQMLAQTDPGALSLASSITERAPETVKAFSFEPFVRKTPIVRRRVVRPTLTNRRAYTRRTGSEVVI